MPFTVQRSLNLPADRSAGQFVAAFSDFIEVLVGRLKTRAYLELARVETRNVPEAERSALARVMAEHAVRSQRWRKWMPEGMDGTAVEDVLKNEELTAQITDICGHYTYEDPAVKAEMARMLDNLAKVGVDGEGYVRYNLKRAIDRYAYCLGLYGTTSRLIAEAKKEQ